MPDLKVAEKYYERIVFFVFYSHILTWFFAKYYRHNVLRGMQYLRYFEIAF